jgi:hypothetical protein
MTAIACWIENNRPAECPNITQQFLWAVGDSRVSNQAQDIYGNSSYSTLHDSAVKIFSVPVTIRSPDDHGSFSNICYFSSLGIAYSGSSITGHNIVSAIAPLLSSLNTLDASALPSLADIAGLLGRIADNYIRSFGFTASPSRAYSEMSLLGFCPATHMAQIFLIEPKVDSSFSIDVQEFRPKQEGDYLLLGDRKDELRALIAKERKLHSHGSLRWWRSPASVIKRCIADKNFQTIGGHIQLGIGTLAGFQIKWIATPIEEGKSPAAFTYLGLSVLNDQLGVGPCFIGMEGMALGL